MSESALESDYEFSETSRFDDSDEEDVSNSTLEVSEDKRSFYEKSLDSQYRGTDMERHLQKGVFLSDNYLKQFKQNRPTSYRQSFYPELLDEASLRKLVRDSPGKYITGIIYFDSTHEAHCKPLDSAQNISIIEISGRSKIGFEVFNEDEVVVEILDDFESKEKRYGKVCGILQRRRQRNVKHPVFLCTLDETECHLVKPLCRTVPKLHILTKEIKKTYKTKKEKENKLEIYQYDEIHGCLKNPRIIDIVPTEKQSYVLAVAYIKWGTRHYYPRGAVIEILPTVRNKNTGLTILNLQYAIPGVYDSGTLKDTGECIQRYEKELENIIKGRLDLTKINTFSVNESNVVDVNYAFSIEEVENGYKIGVHVSDVSEVVKKDSNLDKEAFRRSTTFDSGISKLIHMLPEPLSEDICSLLPGKIRPTISLFLFISNEGTQMQREDKDYEVCLSFIKSSRKLSYKDVDRLLSSDDCDDELTKDVCTLVNLSLRMKANREKYPTDASSIAYDEAFGFRQSGSEWTKANIMTDEILDMANKKITLYLQGKYGDCLPVMYTKPSSNEAVQAFLRNADNNLDLVCKLQNKRIGTKVPKYSTCGDKRTSVILSRNVWEAIKELPKMAGDYIQNDDLHPFQRILYSKLQSILNTVEYKPCGSLKEVKPKPLKSIRFTSPISSFIDMIVIRQLHSALVHGENPYTMKEINGICMYANSMRSKEKEYKQACNILATATDLQNNPMMILAVVSKVSNKSIHLLTNISKKEFELPFSLLDAAEKPIVFQDTKTKFDKVKVTWKKRLYNINIGEKKENEKGFDGAINPYSDVVFVPLHEWAKMLKLSREGNEEALSREIKRANVSNEYEGYDDVTTECIDSLELKPDTKFSMTFSLGQIVRVQITAEHLRGMLNPTLMLYNMTNNVKFCIQHQNDPVNNLYEYALHASCHQYEDVEEYLNIWEPILLMESSIGAVKNEENFCIKNVPIKFNGRKGSFELGLAECESRNIEFSGTLSDEDENDDNEEDTTGKPCYDWLCIKTTVPNTNVRSHSFTDPLWVGHAKIEKVRRKKVSSSAKITVKFSLHEKAPSRPKSIRTVDTKYSVEVLRKMEVDRYIKNIYFILFICSNHNYCFTRT
jgi:exoribonuclease R